MQMAPFVRSTRNNFDYRISEIHVNKMADKWKNSAFNERPGLALRYAAYTFTQMTYLLHTS